MNAYRVAGDGSYYGPGAWSNIMDMLPPVLNDSKYLSLLSSIFESNSVLVHVSNFLATVTR
jgi:hypothetical protein